ncbi:MAG: hydrogenase [Eubacteriales bacterium]|nr:hydrogenase [Eubacteriales bacterium]
MSNIFDTLSVLILLSSFVLMANKRIKSYIRTFRVQSLLIALAAGVMGVKSFASQGHVDLLVVCVIIVLLKVIYIPNLLSKVYSNIEYRVEKDFMLNIPLLVLISCALVVFTYFSMSTVEGLNEGVLNIQLVNSISVFLIGLFFMISRKKAIGQIIGFLELENGLYVCAMFSTHGMPLVVDLGIFVDMLTAVMIMGLMVFRINEKYESINIKKLNRLKG